jgi:probable addiction module antidote protein
MAPKLLEFDVSAYLDNEEAIAEYLRAALEDSDPDVFLAAIGHVAKARGMSAIAQRSGLGRESLYKALAPGAKPRYDTVLKVLHSLGVKLTVTT